MTYKSQQNGHYPFSDLGSHPCLGLACWFSNMLSTPLLWHLHVCPPFWLEVPPPGSCMVGLKGFWSTAVKGEQRGDLPFSANHCFHVKKGHGRLRTFYPQFQSSCSVMSDSLQPHGLQHTRLPCPSPTPGASSNSCSLRW